MSDSEPDIDFDAIQVCEDRFLPLNLILDAAERAVAENPENAPTGTLDASRKIGVAGTASETFGALLTGKKWQVGRVLRVHHLNGDPSIHARVEGFARQWEQFANIAFRFVASEDAEIRISYAQDNRSWSYIGTDALSVPGETMHFGWLQTDAPDSEMRRVVVHEFGHALGMIHEHQHPEAGIQWKREVVYESYRRRMGWSRAMVDSNLFARHDANDTQFDAYDPLSIMHYPVDPAFTVDQRAVGRNTELSETDKRFIARAYPKAAPAADFPAGTMSDAHPEGAGSVGNTGEGRVTWSR